MFQINQLSDFGVNSNYIILVFATFPPPTLPPPIVLITGLVPGLTLDDLGPPHLTLGN